MSSGFPVSYSPIADVWSELIITNWFSKGCVSVYPFIFSSKCSVVCIFILTTLICYSDAEI